MHRQRFNFVMVDCVRSWQFLTLVFLHVLAVLLNAGAEASRPNEVVTLRVTEEAAPSSYVGNFRDAARLVAQFPDDHASFRFQFTKPCDYFAIEETSGVVSTTARIDREAFLYAPADSFNQAVTCRAVTQPSIGLFAPAALLKCSFNLEVLVRTGRSRDSRFYPLTIEVLDINDNPAIWTATNVSLLIPENSPNGTEFKLPSATDLDFLENGRLDYFVKDDFSKLPFRIQPSANRLSLVINGIVDREVRSSYRFLLFVKDGSNLPRTSSIPVSVVITDVNDHRPRFVLAVSEISVSENVARGTILHRFEATDADSSSELRYYFDTVTTQLAAANTFLLDEQTGDLTLNEALDRETQSEYVLNVLVTDGQFDAETSLRVIVTDVNDEPPRIDVRSAGNSANETAVLENEPSGTLVAYVWVTDPDRANAERDPPVHCSLPAGTPFSLRPWAGSGPRYGLYTGEPFDSERSRLLELLISCQDSGQPPLSSRKMVSVHVKDVNDNAPVWQGSYNVVVKENTAASVPIVHVNATDADENRNGVVHYYLNAADVRRWPQYGFEIDRLSGRLTVRRVLDREDVRSLTIEVLAVDLGSPPLTSQTTINITVEDENDKDPQFAFPVYRFGVVEAAQKNSQVGTVQAIDHDATAPNNDIRFRLLQESEVTDAARLGSATGRSNQTPPTFIDMSHSPAPPPLPFEITSTGNILVSGKIDYETQQEYTFVVLAIDGGSPARTGSATVIVAVEDLNDNTPAWIFPNATHRVVSCSLYDPISTEIARLQARDSDANQNGELSYILRYGDLLGHLALNAQSGILYLQKKLDVAHVGMHKIVVEVTDHGLHPLRTQAFLDINVTDQARSFRMADQTRLAFPNERTLVIMLTLIITALFIALLLITIVTFIRMRRRTRIRKRSAKAIGKETDAVERYAEVSANGELLHDCPIVDPKQFDDLGFTDYSDRQQSDVDGFSDSEAVENSRCVTRGGLKGSSRTLPIRQSKKTRLRGGTLNGGKQMQQVGTLCTVQSGNGTPMCRLLTTFQRNDIEGRQMSSVFNSIESRGKSLQRRSIDAPNCGDAMWHSMTGTETYKKCRFAVHSPASQSVRGLTMVGHVGAKDTVDAESGDGMGVNGVADSSDYDTSNTIALTQSPRADRPGAEHAEEAHSFKPTSGACKENLRDKDRERDNERERERRSMTYSDDHDFSGDHESVQPPNANRQLDNLSSPRFVRTNLLNASRFSAPRSESVDSSYV